MKVVICGGRGFKPSDQDDAVLRALLRTFDPEEVLVGGAKGADEWAARVARDEGLRVSEHPADWDLLGKRAGPYRNAEMAAIARGGACIAFPGGRGTSNMIEMAEAARLSIVDLRRRPQ